MLDRVVDLVHRADRDEDIGPAFVMMETQASFDGRPVEDRVGKVFRLARDEVFAEFARRPEVVAPVRQLLGTDRVSNFLSQFIFKNPGAWGQPWHQDSYYFPFAPARPVVGVWLAVTEATLENGCLHVLPGSHREAVHDHVPDRRPNAQYGYVEIVDHDMAASEPVCMAPGDLLLFDSHLMHRSTDNASSGLRAAMVYHYAPTGTRDRTEEVRGYTVNDWIEIEPTTRSVS
jgi:ectoine hydroxylase-related dioxygenase (phytanoyl-CoA dioxygenase family)